MTQSSPPDDLKNATEGQHSDEYSRRNILEKTAAAGMFAGGGDWIMKETGQILQQSRQSQPQTDVTISGPTCVTETESFTIVVENAEPGVSFCEMDLEAPDGVQIIDVMSLIQGDVTKQVDGSTARIKIENARAYPYEGQDLNIIQMAIECDSGGEGLLVPYVWELRTVAEDGEEEQEYEAYGVSKNIEFTQGSFVLTVKGDYSPGINYEVEVEDDLEKISCGCSVNESDNITGNVAKGTVVEGCDSYGFSWDPPNRLVRFAAEVPENHDGVTVELESEFDDVYPPIVYEDGLSEDVGVHTLTIEEPDNTWVNYEFEGENNLQKSDALNASINSNDTISGNIATGGVKNGRDSYTYTGSFERFAADGYVRVLLDGAKINPYDWVSVHTVTIEETAGNWANYELKVSGSIRKSDALNASKNDSDEINGSTASGLVHNGRDSYVYSGSIENFSWDDEVNIYLDGSYR